MRIAAEVPYERRTFDSPYIPDLIVLQVAVRVVRHVQTVEAAAFLEDGHDFFDIVLAVDSEQDFKRLGNQFFLVAAEIGDSDAGELAFLTLQLDFIFTG